MFATALSALAARFIGSIVFLATTPVIYASLGATEFGMYQFTQRLALFGGLTNLGASSFLKLRLSALAGSGAEVDGDRRVAIGTCIAQWLLSLPIVIVYCLVGAVLITSSGRLTELLAVSLLLFAVPLAQILSIAQVSLFATGLGYRGTAISIGAAVLTGVLVAVAAASGGGLLAMALAILSTLVVCGVLTTRIAMKALPWFGFDPPGWSLLGLTSLRSIGASVASATYLGLQQTEVIATGLAYGSALVGHLIISCFAVQFLEIAVRSMISASAPALGPAIRENRSDDLSKIRRRVEGSIGVLYILSSVPIIALSQGLVSLWIGPEAFTSEYIVGASLIISYCRAMSQFDAQILDQAGNFYWKTGLAFLLVFLPAVATAIWLSDLFGFNAMMSIIALGFWLYSSLIHLRCNLIADDRFQASAVVGPVLVLVVVAAAIWVGQPNIQNRIILAVLGAPTIALMLVNFEYFRQAFMYLMHSASRFLQDLRLARWM